MVGLLDIAPITKTIQVQGQDIPVTGISARGIAILIDSFPEIKTMLLSGKFDAGALIKSAPELAAALIAAGTGTPGDKKAEEIAIGLPVEAQFDILEATVALTAPSGVVPFVNRLTGWLNSMQPETGGSGPLPVQNTGTATSTI